MLNVETYDAWSPDRAAARKAEAALCACPDVEVALALDGAGSGVGALVGAQPTNAMAAAAATAIRWIRRAISLVGERR